MAAAGVVPPSRGGNTEGRSTSRDYSISRLPLRLARYRDVLTKLARSAEDDPDAQADLIPFQFSRAPRVKHFSGFFLIEACTRHVLTLLLSAWRVLVTDIFTKLTVNAFVQYALAEFLSSLSTGN